MFDALVEDLSQRYGLGDRGRDLFGLLVAYVHNDRRGGFTGFIEGFREQGHGELVSSWLGNPEAGGLTASDVGMVFGQGLLNDWGGRLGVSRATVATAISGVLPRLVAEMTPGGRIPGGFAPPPSPEADAMAAPRRELRDRPVPVAPHETATATDPDDRWRSTDAIPPARDPGRPMPAQERARFDLPFGDGAFEGQGAAAPRPAPAAALRREPVLDGRPAAPRAPVESRPALDAADQRAADMAAAFDRRDRAEPADRGMRADARPESWRSAVHPPRRKRGLGWLFWLVVLLALLGGAAWFAWTQGLLAPYIEQLQLPIQSSPSTV